MNSTELRHAAAPTTPVPLDPETVQEAVEIFKALLRFNTVNPPGNEKPLIDWVAELLRKEGIEPVVLESAPGRANLVAKLSGGSEPALLLTGHVDVVPVEREHWTADPFGAEERDGWIYGRGAVDMKHHVAMCIAVFVALKRRRVKLNRDVKLLLVADEEAGCHFGMKWMVEQHADLIAAGYGLNEFGGFNIYLPGGRQAILVQTAERGVCWFRIRAQGEPGHGSLPPLDSAVRKLTAAVQRLANQPLPHHLVPEAKRYLDALGKAMGATGFVTKLLQHRAGEALALKLMPDQETRNTMLATLHNTAVPTVLRAGDKTNVVPSSASCEVDGRYLPGFTSEQFLAEVRQVVGPEIDIEVLNEGPPSSTPIDTPLWRTIVDVCGDRAPGVPVIPWLLIGFSDTKWLSTLGIQVYGFSPLKLPPGVQFARLPHGHDERAPRAGFEWGVETLWQTVARFVSQDPQLV